MFKSSASSEASHCVAMSVSIEEEKERKREISKWRNASIWAIQLPQPMIAAQVGFGDSYVIRSVRVRSIKSWPQSKTPSAAKAIE